MPNEYQKKLKEIVDWIQKKWIGQKREYIELILAGILLRENPCLYAQPGTGKTDVSKAFARLLGMKFKKIACTEARKSLAGALYKFKMTVTKTSQSAEEQKISYDTLFTEIKPNDYALILIDEVNRGSLELQNELLGLLEEGYLTTAYGDTTHVNWRFILAMNSYAGELDRALADRCIFIPVSIPQFLPTFQNIQERLQQKLVKEFSSLAKPILTSGDIPKILDEIAKVKVPPTCTFLACLFTYSLICMRLFAREPDLYSSIFTCAGSGCKFATRNIIWQAKDKQYSLTPLCSQVRYPPATRSVHKIIRIAKALAYIRGRNETEPIDVIHSAKAVLLKYLRHSTLVDELFHEGRIKLYTEVTKHVSTFTQMIEKDKDVAVKSLIELSRLANFDVGVSNLVGSLLKSFKALIPKDVMKRLLK